MKKSCFVMLLGAVLSAATATAETQVYARVKGDRVNMRARPDLQSETVGQLTDGTMLPLLGQEENWVQVAPPRETDFWVHRDFVDGDKVLVNKLNARSGPGINYNVVGSFAKGDAITRRGQFGDWVKIAPPPDAGLWVSADLVDIVYPAPEVPPPVAAPRLTPPSPPAEPPVTEVPASPSPAVAYGVGRAPSTVPPAPPSDLELVPLAGQGQIVKREGELKRANFFLMRSPGTHRLIERKDNRIITTAYLRGNSQQLNSLVGERLVVQGREYWVEGSKIPVIVIELIEKRSF